jgi:hypothetical protein
MLFENAHAPCCELAPENLMCLSSSLAEDMHSTHGCGCEWPVCGANSVWQVCERKDTNPMITPFLIKNALLNDHVFQDR